MGCMQTILLVIHYNTPMVSEMLHHPGFRGDWHCRPSYLRSSTFSAKVDEVKVRYLHMLRLPICGVWSPHEPDSWYKSLVVMAFWHIPRIDFRTRALYSTPMEGRTVRTNMFLRMRLSITSRAGSYDTTTPEYKPMYSTNNQSHILILRRPGSGISTNPKRRIVMSFIAC